jgi:hypothetical protein
MGRVAEGEPEQDISTHSSFPYSLFYSFLGVDPLVMGIGPAVAIPAALQKANLNSSDIDVWEINEAFASQATYCVVSTSCFVNVSALVKTV